MKTVSLTEAKARLGKLVDQAATGKPIYITRHGKPVARLVGPPKRPIDVEALRRVTERMPFQPESAGDFIRRMRDEDRY